ncbi:alpha/beta hydrolase [Fulvivirga lutimaris]|uniref:alpha/beta hydrolase n=1 Tax=Fulvivirga lutimaris TaxID=1819566 RepID=UPI001629A3E1|nr:alpha/beta fold hydrolase [Fulvivirga lutimaris]
MKALKWTFIIISIIVLGYVAGPSVDIDTLIKDLPTVPSDLNELEKFVDEREAAIPNIKPNNEGRIIWNDSVHTKTEYSMVYLHGFSASQEEGAPIHEKLAKKYGCNLYLPRIAGHGLVEDEPMLNLTAEQMMESAKEAIAIGMQLGEKVILLTTSTGGTYGLYLAENNPSIAGIVLYSPNIDLYDESSYLLTKPWGLQMARLVVGSDYNQWPLDSVRANYWTNKYRLEVLTQLRAMVDETMTPETFETVTCPVFLGYYYKNDTAQDNTVSVPAMLTMYDQISTPEEQKRKVAFPEAGHHVIGCYLTSGAVEEVETETEKFLEEVIGLKPVNNKTAYAPQTVDDELAVEINQYLISDYLKREIKVMNEADRQYQFHKIDLNEDGVDEIFIRFESTFFCGSGGCTYLLMDVNFNTITQFTVMNAPIYVEPQKVNGWKVLLVKSEGEPKELKFEDGTYPANPSVLPKAPFNSPSAQALVLFDDDTSKSKVYQF